MTRCQQRIQKGDEMECSEAKQLTEEQAIAFYNSGIWKEWSDRHIAEFQMMQNLLCVPFDVFHKAIEGALGRPVWTREFGLNRDGLMGELFLDKEPPTFQEIMEMIPEEKRIIRMI